ncbi:MAG TPA: pilus assembly protein N-terminal domain-containing protein [Bryobacteraceae bacterium]|nr:pilus assembly protein N-terminal domain-containing protein [Bryobacteraceae bacterium]
MTRSSLIHPGRLALGLVFAGAVVFGQAAEDLRLTVGKSIVIDYPSDIRTISTSSADIIDASPVTTREILVHGKGLGGATMIVWSKSGQRTFYNVNVDLNLDPLRKILKDTFPAENITVRGERDEISLNGRIANKDTMDRAMSLAAGFAKTVVNNLQLGAPPIDKQILLRVKFAELDRSKEVQYGVNMFGLPGQTLIGSTTGQFSNGSFSGTAGVSTGTTAASQALMTITQALSLFAFDPKLNLGAFIKALQDNAILEILSEPNLVTTNGKEATFLVGGEFPVPVLQGGANSGAVTIQFREFGIKLIFTPIITANGTIKMHLRQEVSTLDFADGVSINGFTIPALSTKRTETDVELGEGQSFVVSGLLDQRDQETLSKIPVLSSLPIFGSLFKSKDITKSRQELVMLVTPEITMPLNPGDPKPEPYFPGKFLVKLNPGQDIDGKPEKKK